jgi:CubicO group peptidase (beta-lactamase class C family)
MGDLITFMKGVKSWHLFDPGERWFYLNEGYEILEKIVEIVSGMGFKEFIRKEIFEPLNLQCTFLDEFSEEFAFPYYPKDGKIEKGKIPGGPMNGAGGIACSAIDLARYGYMYISKDGRVVSSKSIEEMETPRIKIPYDIPYGNYYYGYVLMIMDDFYGRKVIGHGGSVLVYTANMLYSREDDVSVAVLSNSTGYPMKNFALYALSEFIGIDPDELPFTKRERVYSKLAGSYKTYRGTIEGRVRINGDFLTLELFEDISKIEIILVPEKIEENKAIFHTLSHESIIPVEFVQRNGKTIMIYERYVFEKV